jgi:hypothetical protein
VLPAFNCNLFRKELNFILVQHVCAFMLVHNFIWLSAKEFEFKFHLNSNSLSGVCKRKEGRKTRQRKTKPGPKTLPQTGLLPTPHAAHTSAAAQLPPRTQPAPASARSR